MRPGVGGNRRAGLISGGSLLLLIGMGGGILLNIYLHMVPALGQCQMFLRIMHVCSEWGWYATVVLALGAFATLIGSGMIWLGLQLPSSPLRLFDTEGAYPPDPAEP